MGGDTEGDPGKASWDSGSPGEAGVLEVEERVLTKEGVRAVPQGTSRAG